MNAHSPRVPRRDLMMKTRISLFFLLLLLALHAGAPVLAKAPERATGATTELAPRPGIDPGPATPDAPSIGNDGEGTCCNGMGGPVEDEPVVVIGHGANPDGGRRHRLAPTDANLERRYAPRPAPSLNPITLRF